MNRTLPRAAPEPISERDAAWLEELAGAVERGRAAILARKPWTLPTGDAALSLLSLVDAGLPGDSLECEFVARRLIKRQELPANATATLLLALWRSGYVLRAAFGEAIHDAIQRLQETQNSDGSWPAPGGEAGCVPTTARVLEALGCFGFRAQQRPVDDAVRFLLAQQAECGAWPGTGQVLAGLKSVGFDVNSLVARRAVRWLKDSQNEDGGWGEPESNASQTAWALLGLLAAGETAGPEARAGAEFLVGTQRAGGEWGENAPEPACLALTALGRYAQAVTG